MKVCVLGLGTIGMTVAEYISKHDFDVYGYDIAEKSVETIETFTDWESVPQCDIYVVAVLSNSVKEVCKKISNKNKNSLVCLESTVPVGTCRKISKNFNLSTLIHCPHRLWIGDLNNHGVKQLRAFGATNEEGLQKGLDFYRYLDIPLHICASIEIAEICKIAENSYRFVQIAFAEELRMICESSKIPFDDVRKACNTKWNIEVHEAREGIYGECLLKDTRYLRLLIENAPILDGAILTDKKYKKWIKRR